MSTYRDYACDGTCDTCPTECFYGRDGAGYEVVTRPEREDAMSDYREDDQAAHVADSGQQAITLFIAGQLAAQVKLFLTGVKPFDVLLFPDGNHVAQPSFVIEFRESGLRYRVSVEPDGKREKEARG